MLAPPDPITLPAAQVRVVDAAGSAPSVAIRLRKFPPKLNFALAGTCQPSLTEEKNAHGTSGNKILRQGKPTFADMQIYHECKSTLQSSGRCFIDNKKKFVYSVSCTEAKKGLNKYPLRYFHTTRTVFCKFAKRVFLLRFVQTPTCL